MAKTKTETKDRQIERLQDAMRIAHDFCNEVDSLSVFQLEQQQIKVWLVTRAREIGNLLRVSLES